MFSRWPVLRRMCPMCLRRLSCSPHELASAESERVLLQLQSQLPSIALDIRTHLTPVSPLLREMTHHHFVKPGKLVRPLLVLLVAQVCNSGAAASANQRIVAMVTEMIHTASLIHDDLIDASDLRRGLASVQSKFGQRQAVLAGDYIIGIASQLVASTGSTLVVRAIATAISDLVRGEVDQLSARASHAEDVSRYLLKTYRKTASLLANSAKSAAVLSPDSSPQLAAAAFELGRNVGMAFQLVDDLLDIEASAEQLGKPACADLQLGIVTGPVLFALQHFPQLRPLVRRQFADPGDLEFVLDCVRACDGVGQTRMLAQLHCREAHRQLSLLPAVPASEALHLVIDRLLARRS